MVRAFACDELRRDHLAALAAVVFLDDHHKIYKLTLLVLGGDPAARSHRVEQFTAL